MTTREATLAGKCSPPSSRHIFLCTTSPPSSWPSSVLDSLQSRFDKSSVRVTLCQALEGVDEEGDVLVFPDFVRFKSFEELESALRTNEESALRTNEGSEAASRTNEGLKSTVRTNEKSALRTNEGSETASRTNEGLKSTVRTNEESALRTNEESALRTNEGSETASRTNEGLKSTLRTNEESAVRTNEGSETALRTNEGLKSTLRTNEESALRTNQESALRNNEGFESALRTNEGLESAFRTKKGAIALKERASVMVCCHGTRDVRCGITGAVLADEFARMQSAEVKTRRCSHVGGHQYAGNVVLFRAEGAGDWFGYVTKEEVGTVLSMTESFSPDSYPPHEMHALWRGRAGVSEGDHPELCSRVCAACDSCTVEVRDMEEGVMGWPSPTVRDADEKKRFILPLSVKKNSSPLSSLAAASAPVPPLPQARVVFVLGAPGSGKGTQCSNLIRDYSLIHLSAGDLLRDERTNPASTDGQLIETYIKDGKIVPVAITVRLIWVAMTKYMTKGKCNFLIDGFPRNQDNMDGWNAQITPDKARVVGVLFLDCAESIVEARLLERGKTSGRSDDNIESIRKRFATFRNETMPIVNVFDERSMCWRIDSARPIDAVYADVKQFVEEFVIPRRRTVVFVLGGPGSGKGTNCANLVRDFDCLHLSAGDLLRAERQNPNSKDGALIENYIKEGKIVPVEITVNLLLKAMETSSARNCLIDGFPRSLDNVLGWERVAEASGDKFNVAGVLFLQVPEQVMEQRLLERAVKDGGNVRSDDNIDSIRKRFTTFTGETMPIVDRYAKKNMVWIVDANRPITKVFADVVQVMKPVFLPKILGGALPKIAPKISVAKPIIAVAEELKDIVAAKKELRFFISAVALFGVAYLAFALLKQNSAKD